MFWQTDENDQTMWIDEAFPVQLSNSNVKKKFDLYGDFKMSVTIKESEEKQYSVSFDFNNSQNFENCIKTELLKQNKEFENYAAREFSAWIKACELTATYYHRHYIEDAEYIPFEEDIETFLKREIDKPIISWEYTAKEGDKEILGYEILPNKYFYKYIEPEKSLNLIQKFWQIEKDSEKLLKTIN